MIDEPDQPPWLIFRFDIATKELLAVPASNTEHIRGCAPRRTLTNQIQATGEFQEVTMTLITYIYLLARIKE